jgi:hypothetical protein
MFLAAPKPAATPWDAPVLVVERNQVVWPEKCEGDAPPDGVADRLKAAIGEEPDLVFVGNGRVADVTLGAPSCVKGECGAAQVAFPLATGGDAEATGIVVPRDLFGKGEPGALNFTMIEGTDPYGDGRLVAGKLTYLPVCGEPPKAEVPEKADAANECRGYRVEHGSLAVQVQGAGHLQESQYPLFTTARFRILEKKGQEWAAGGWQALARGNASRLPVPVGIVPGGEGPAKVLWLRQLGVCCPSDSSGWISETGKTSKDGTQHSGGLGQPCD